MKVLFTLSLLFLSLHSWSQETITIDSRLLAVYEQAYLERLQTENPFLLQRLNFYLDHAYYLSDYPEAKGEMNLPVVTIQDTDQINILALERDQELRKDFETETAYSINGSRQVLILRSGREFVRLLNEELARTYPKKSE